MITVKDKEYIEKLGGHIQRVVPDRPEVKKSVRKLLYFLVREGVSQTGSKVLSKLFKGKIDSAVYSAQLGKLNAVSYDGGDKFYLSDQEREEGEWLNPFAYDVVETLGEGPASNSELAEKALFLFGCGDYARTYSLGTFKLNQKLVAVDYNDKILGAIANKFEVVGNHISQTQDVWRRSQYPIALIASYHSDHAAQASFLHQLNSDSYIFIEKPASVNESDIEIINALYDDKAKFEIGFNRRYAPVARKVKALLGRDPKIISITVNEVKIRENHWYQWPNQGTRITGNACHWLDLCQWFVDSEPDTLLLNFSPTNSDDCILCVSYEDGSLVSITLTDKGNDLRGVQEYIEIKESNRTIRIDDFIRLEITNNEGVKKVRRYVRRDKGHARMYQAFKDNVDSKEFVTRYPKADFNRVAKMVYTFSQMLINGENLRKL